jgi:hypothetical protein
MVYVDYWWSITENDCALFYQPPRGSRTYWGRPQCNADQRIAEKVGTGLYPMPTTVRQIPVAFVPLNVGDY